MMRITPKAHHSCINCWISLGILPVVGVNVHSFNSTTCMHTLTVSPVFIPD